MTSGFERMRRRLRAQKMAMLSDHLDKVARGHRVVAVAAARGLLRMYEAKLIFSPDPDFESLLREYIDKHTS